jgi:hypothetical protein
MSAIPTGGGGRLAAALDTLLAGHRQADLDDATAELIAVYRSGKPPPAPAVSSQDLALAYAAHAYPLRSARVCACRGLTSHAASWSSSAGFPMTTPAAST